MITKSQGYFICSALFAIASNGETTQLMMAIHGVTGLAFMFLGLCRVYIEEWAK